MNFPAEVGTIATLLLAFQVNGFICNATDDESAPALVEFATLGTVEREFETSESPETNHSTPIGSDWFEKWERPERLQQLFPIYKLGTDEDGVPIYLNLNGRYNFKTVLDQGSEEEKAAVDSYFDYITDGFKADDEANGGNGVVVIIDWDGFTIRNYNRPAVIQLAIRQFAKLGKLYNILRRTYSINTNFAAETLMNLSKQHLGKMLEKMEVYGTQREKWVPQLRRAIPENFLPVKYGGKNENIEL